MATKEQTDDPSAADVRDALASPQLALQSVYLKDCSYEAPNGPRIEGAWNPQINLDLNTTVNAVAPSAKHAEVTVFLVEVKQAGVFLMKNLSELELNRALAIICPSVLFPYARAAVSQLVTQGGFPQFLLPPVNFEALHSRSDTNGSVATN